MTLSEDEARTLAEIEVDCRRDDPDFADRMDLAAARSLFSLGTIIACYGFVIVTLAAGIWLRLRRQRRW